MSVRLNKFFAPLTLGVLLLIVYSATLAPGLTWANSGSDGGDLITAAAVGGVPHPTGYPTYLILARAFQVLPIGSLAYRTNLMSAIFTCMAAALLCDVLRRIPVASERRAALTAWTAGLAFGLSPLIWSQAVITEVYALEVFAIVLAIWLLTKLSAAPRADLFFGVFLGLLPGIHLTTVLLIPAFMLARALDPAAGGSLRTAAISLLRQAGGLAIGLLIFAVLPLRAMQHPSVDWGGASSPARLWWLVSGQLYQDNFSVGAAALGDHARSMAALLLDQAGLPGVALGVLGLIWYFRRSRWILLTAWMFAAAVGFAASYQTEDFNLYLIPAIVSFAIWFGWGSALLAQQLSQRWRLAGDGLTIMLIAYLLVLAASHWAQVDAAHDARAENFARAALQTLPPGAIVLARGDGAVFALWYEVFALRQRTDLVVLAEDLLPFPWYRETLHATYPGLVLPDQAEVVWAVDIQRGNVGRPLCFAIADASATIDCPQGGAREVGGK